jgi:voltage-gated potassium channel Kch
LVFLLGLGAFFSGVGTTGVTDPQDQRFLAWLYQTAGLFVFGGLDLGAPTGGGLLGRATAVVEALLRLVRPDWLQRRALKDHIILAGTGRVGLAYLEAIRSVEPNRTVALVDSGEGLATEAEVLKLGRTEILRGDIRRPGTLDALRLDRADRMIVLTDDDMANLDMAWGGKERAPDLPIAVHVADLTLLRPVNRIIRDQRRPEGSSSPLIFNTARIAALNLFDQHLYPHFQETGQLDVLLSWTGMLLDNSVSSGQMSPSRP